ncbi:globin family protein [Phenylobacterium sp.]|jgi:nitric oxide dioxygenase|uniref:globin family protein n=1 Tax=Phenylobacterium sp. TaxID=1871053 RepID=UPI002F959089
MTPDQIQLVRATFAEVAPIRAQAARLFYARLFEVAPDVRPMFKADLAAQGAKLMAAIAFVVGALDQPEVVGPQVEALGRRHGGYGVQAIHYKAVGDTLIWMLETSLGEILTPPAKRAWLAAYDLLSSAMIAAASEPEPA